MQFIFDHWHHILPIVGIIAVAMIFMRDKPKKEAGSEKRRRNSKSAKTDENQING